MFKRKTSAPAQAIVPQAPLPSVIGPELTIEGRIVSSDEVQVYGTVVGDILANRVVLCPGCQVEGNVVAREACIRGQFRGRVFAFDVEVGMTAVVEGRIFHHRLSMAAGARVDGRMPWRPVNFFERIDLDQERGSHEHVFTKR